MSGDASYTELMAGSVPQDRLPLLVRYAELLERWSRTHSLVSWRSRQELVERHVFDSLAAAPLLGESGRLLDVGSGAGLPGIPLLVAREGWRGLLLEPRQKRWAFLKLVIRELDLDAEVRRTRYQDLREGGQFHLITSRALGGYGDLITWARTRLCEEGVVMLWATGDEHAWQSEFPQWRVLSSPLPGLDNGRLVQLRPCFT